MPHARNLGLAWLLLGAAQAVASAQEPPAQPDAPLSAPSAPSAQLPAQASAEAERLPGGARPAAPDVLDAHAPVPPLPSTDAFAGYHRYAPPAVRGWRQTNAEVAPRAASAPAAPHAH